VQASWPQPGVRLTLATSMDADDCLEEPTIGNLFGHSLNCPCHEGLTRGFAYFWLAFAVHAWKDDPLVAAFEGGTGSLDNRHLA
jgi:hypothetical protein